MRSILYPFWTRDQNNNSVKLDRTADLYQFAQGCGLSQGFLKTAEEEEVVAFVKAKCGLWSSPPPTVLE